MTARTVPRLPAARRGPGPHMYRCAGGPTSSPAGRNSGMPPAALQSAVGGTPAVPGLCTLRDTGLEPYYGIGIRHYASPSMARRPNYRRDRNQIDVRPLVAAFGRLDGRMQLLV